MIRIATPHIPPSVNAAYSNNKGKGRGRIRTAAYRSWANAFGYDINTAMRGQKPILGPYSIVITLDRSTRNKLSDIMNREKCVSDILEEYKVIENDRFCESGTVRWGEASGGMLIEIAEFPYSQA